MKSDNNVLFISYDGLTDPLGQSQIIPYLAGLSKKGYTIFILSCEKKERFLNLSGVIREILNGNGIVWIPVKYTINPPVISSVYNLVKMYFAGKRIIRSEQIRILHCRSTLPAIIGRLVQKKKSVRLLFDMRGFWADERVEGGLWPQSNIVYRLIYKMVKNNENRLITHADHLISLTHEGKTIVEQRMKSNKKQVPVTVIPCCADLQLFNPLNYDQEVVASKKKILELNENTFILSYLGSIGTWYMLDEMLQFFKVLIQKIPDACFLFITKENPVNILSVAAKIGVKAASIRIVPAERNEIPGLLAICNVTIFFIKPGYSKKASSPTKLGESLAMGVPIICNSGVGDCDYFMVNNSAGWIINSFDETSYSKLTEEIKNHVNYKKDAIRKIGEQYFSLEKAIEKYAVVYRQLLH